MDDTNSGSASAGGAGTSEVEDKDAYTVGWICALPLEMAAANLMLDKIYDIQIVQDSSDHNSYILGLMQGHNVVIACLPDGIYGTNPAATVAKDMLRTFKSIRFGLLVGVGGGAPSSDNDIRLGDVVVSKPTGTSGGVIQYDRGKTTQHKIERTGSLNAPPIVLLTALSRLQARQKLGQSDIPRFLSEAVEKIKKPKIRQKFAHQGDSNDRLFKAEYGHDNADSNCDGCDLTQTIEREDRDDTEPVVHYGNIASGNQVIKHGKTRDELSKEFGALCFEMEAAGLMQEFPCLVIRGICDYSDAHKNKRWQEYAATTAAAFAKELLSIVSSGQVKKENKIVLDPKLYTLVSDIRNDIRNQRQEQHARRVDEKDQECLRALSRTDSFVDKEHILEKKDKLLRKSYRWIIENPEFRQWRNSTQSRRLWIKGDPGKGKTMLLCGIIEELENSNRLCYFFCQATEERLSTANAVLRGLILHLVRQYPALISHVRKEYDNKYEATFDGHNAWQDLCRILKSMLEDEYLGEVLIIVDALDECKSVGDREKLLKFLCKISSSSRAKLIVSSRNWPDIEKELGKKEDHAVTLSLELNASSISHAVNEYIEWKVEGFAEVEPYKSNSDLRRSVRSHLEENSRNTFLWVSLVCQELSGSKATSRRNVKRILGQSPAGLEGLYGRMIENIFDSEDQQLCMEILAVISVVTRPITFQELFYTIGHSLYDDLEPEDLESIIESCGSFLNMQKDTIYIVHQSAVDFLHSSASKLPSVAERHQAVFWNSLNALLISDDIKRDMYGIETPATPYEEIEIPYPDPLSALNYSWTYWVDHLAEWVCGRNMDSSATPPTDTEAISSIQTFLETKFLYWVEGLALHGQMQPAVRAIQRLQRLMNEIPNASEQNLAVFVHDATRFLLSHRFMIETTPFQLYASALVFSPDESIVKKTFRHEAPDWVTATLRPGTSWTACLQTLLGHEQSVTSMSYSTNGQWFLSGSCDGTAKLWDAETGACLNTIGDHGWMEYQEPFCPGNTHTYVAAISIVMFSADDQQIITGSRNGIVKVWNRSNGVCVRETRYHSDDAECLAISADHRKVAFAFRDTISIWYEEENYPFLMLQAHGYIQSMNFSPNGKVLAATVVKEGKGAVTIWNLETGVSEQTLDGHTLGYCSRNTQWLMSSGYAVRAWETDLDGHVSSPFVFHWEPDLPFPLALSHFNVHCMTFSEKHQLLAVAGHGFCSVWDVATGALVWSRHQTYFILAISPDACRLLATTDENAIEIWDLSMSQSGNTFKNNEGRPWRVCFSTDGQQVAAYYNTSHKVKFWNMTSSGQNTEIHHDDDRVNEMAFSADSKHFAIGSITGKITVWDLQTGALMTTWGENKPSASQECRPYDTELEEDDSRENDSRANDSGGIIFDGIDPPRRYVTSLAFRGDLQLASSAEGVISMWDIPGGKCEKTLHGPDFDTVYKMTFSSNGNWLAHAFLDSEYNWLVAFWNMATGSYAIVPEVCCSVESLVFSVDNQLVWSSCDKITIWDVNSNTWTHSIWFDDHTFDEIHLSFDDELPSRLYTEFGFLDLHRLGTSAITAPGVDQEGRPRLPGYTLSRNWDWIWSHGEKRLWIPPEYRYRYWEEPEMKTPLATGTNGPALTWSTDTGRIVRLQFDTER